MSYFEKDAAGASVKRMSARWYAVFVDCSGQLRRLALMEDKKASGELARRINDLNSVRAGGGMMTPDLTRFVETMQPGIRAKLAEWGILSAARVAAGKPLDEHLADWKRSILAKGGTQRHADLVTGRAGSAFRACGFKFWSHISASKLQAHLADLRADKPCKVGEAGKPEKAKRGISAQTFNFYVQAVKQFARWMVRDGRASESALMHLQGVNVRTDRRHDRRALAPLEIRWLLDVTDNADAPERHGMTGPARAMLYRLAVESGLRAAELRSLTRASFMLDGNEPSVTIAAAYAKNRRQDALPLRLDTAALLATHLAGKMPTAQAFAVPRRTDVIRMFRADMADARRTWIAASQTALERFEREGSTFLSDRDESGRWADFHALRHTFITGLVTGGVNPKVAQTLARHSTIGLTMDRYTHLYAGNLAAALDVLPDLSAPERQTTLATGTDGKSDQIRLSPSLSPNGKFRLTSVESGEFNSDVVPSHGTPGNTEEKHGFPGTDDRPGEVAERLNAPVLKTGWPARVTGVRISPSPFKNGRIFRIGRGLHGRRCRGVRPILGCSGRRRASALFPQTKPRQDAALQRAESPLVGQHSHQHHHDHHCDHLGHVGAKPGFLQQISQAVRIDEDVHQFGPHQRPPGEAEALAQTACQCGQAGRKHHIPVEPPALCPEHPACPRLHGWDGRQAVAQGDGEREKAAQHKHEHDADVIIAQAEEDDRHRNPADAGQRLHSQKQRTQKSIQPRPSPHQHAQHQAQCQTYEETRRQADCAHPQCGRQCVAG